MERPTFQKAIDSAKSHAREAVGGLALLALAAVACKGGQGQEVKTTPTQPANSPVATETIAPTPTPSPEPTSVPTEVTTEIPATVEEVRDAFREAYSKLDYATLANLQEDQTQAYIENRLGICNGDIAIPDIPPEILNYGTALIDGCTSIPQHINGIPGSGDILEFSVALERLGSFTLDKIDKLRSEGKLQGTEEEFRIYKVDVAAYFSK